LRPPPGHAQLPSGQHAGGQQVDPLSRAGQWRKGLQPSLILGRQKGGVGTSPQYWGGGDCVYCLMSDSPFGRKTQSCGGYHLMLQLRESGSQLCSLELRQRKCGIPPLQMTAQGLLSTRQSRPSTQGDHMAARAGGGGCPPGRVLYQGPQACLQPGNRIPQRGGLGKRSRRTSCGCAQMLSEKKKRCPCVGVPSSDD